MGKTHQPRLEVRQGASPAPHLVLVLTSLQTEPMIEIFQSERVSINAQRLVSAARSAGVPCIGVEDYPERYGPLVTNIRLRCDAVVASQGFVA